MSDPIRSMEQKARELLPSLSSQGVFLWEGPAIVIGCLAFIALVAFLILGS